MFHRLQRLFRFAVKPEDAHFQSRSTFTSADTVYDYPVDIELSDPFCTPSGCDLQDNVRESGRSGTLDDNSTFDDWILSWR